MIRTFRSLKTRPLCFASICLLSAVFLTSCAEKQPSRPSFYASMARPDAAIDQQAAASMLSLYRKNNGLGALTPDPALSAIAKSQASAMAKAGSVSASLDADQKLTARMASIGEPQTQAVENVSGGYRTLAEAFSGWRESPKHNAVMLDKNGTRFGLATAYSASAKHKVFWSLIVAAPKP